jgi:hypothetical protein
MSTSGADSDRRQCALGGVFGTGAGSAAHANAERAEIGGECRSGVQLRVEDEPARAAVGVERERRR